MTNEDDFAQRRKTAEAAKAMLLERFKSRKPQDDADLVARAAERRAIADARSERLHKRQAEKDKRRAEALSEEQARNEARRAAEAAEHAAVKAADDARRQADRNRAVRVVEDEAARKAQRDARYQARKARSQA